MVLLEKIFFYLLVLCLPFQTRKILHIWGGEFNEWTSVYLYLTDILLILLFLFWLRRIKEKRFLKRISFNLKGPGFWLGAFLILGLISLIQARNLPLSFYSWFKLLEFIILFFYLKNNFKELFNFNRLAQVFVLSGLIQSVIALFQFAQQRSLGLRWLLESPLGPEISGVAKVVVNNLTFVRAYGSLPHPNVLAAFLLVSIFFIYYLWLRKKHVFFENCILLITYSLLVFALFFTFSRSVIFVFIIASLIYLFCSSRNKDLSRKVIGIFSLLLILCFFFSYFAWPEVNSRFSVSSGEQAVVLRELYTKTASSLIGIHPWLGVGLGNFVWEIREGLDLFLPWVAQPVHNIYLLISSEVGLISLVLFLMFLYQLFRNMSFKDSQIRLLCYLLVSFLILGLFDHFFWTLQQGQLMFWLVLGLLAGENFHDLTSSEGEV